MQTICTHNPSKFQIICTHNQKIEFNKRFVEGRNNRLIRIYTLERLWEVWKYRHERSWKILLILTFPTQGQYYLIWNLNTNRSFYITSVKTTIFDKVQEGSNNVGTEIYQHLWESTIPKKCKVFDLVSTPWRYKHSWKYAKKTTDVEFETFMVCAMQIWRRKQDHLFNTCSCTKGIW